MITGSGIAVVVSHLLAKKEPYRLLWSARDPRTTYCDALVEEMIALCPHMAIWDTTVRGKPDLAEMSVTFARALGCEAVLCIANRELTFEVVDAVEIAGIPAFGAIWDS